MGSWIDIDFLDRFANITKYDETFYLYSDNEGEYTAIFKDGVLSIDDTGDAKVYFNAKSDCLISIYGGQTSKFKKK